jgi:hypothetical protein
MHRQNGTSGRRPDGYTTTAGLPDWHTAVIDPRWQHRRHLDEPGAEHSDALSAYRAEQHYPAPGAVANVQIDHARVGKYVQ